MKLNQRKILRLDLTIDSSETATLNQGGRISLSLPNVVDGDSLHIYPYDEIIVSFQLLRDPQGEFDFVNTEAAKERMEKYAGLSRFWPEKLL